MKTLLFNKEEFDRLIENAQKNYSDIIQGINRENREYYVQCGLPELHYNILNRLHQQAMIYSNQLYKYYRMKREMYGVDKK